MGNLHRGASSAGDYREEALPASVDLTGDALDYYLESSDQEEHVSKSFSRTLTAEAISNSSSSSPKSPAKFNPYGQYLENKTIPVSLGEQAVEPDPAPGGDFFDHQYFGDLCQRERLVPEDSNTKCEETRSLGSVDSAPRSVLNEAFNSEEKRETDAVSSGLNYFDEIVFKGLENLGSSSLKVEKVNETDGESRSEAVAAKLGADLGEIDQQYFSRSESTPPSLNSFSNLSAEAADGGGESSRHNTRKTRRTTSGTFNTQKLLAPNFSNLIFFSYSSNNKCVLL